MDIATAKAEATTRQGYHTRTHTQRIVCFVSFGILGSVDREVFCYTEIIKYFLKLQSLPDKYLTRV